jgi:hypothetical protein
MGCAVLRRLRRCVALRWAARVAAAAVCLTASALRCSALTAARSAAAAAAKFNRSTIRTHIHCARAPALNEAIWISEMASAAPAAATAAAGSASSSQQPASVPSFQLTGHSKPVLCLHAAGDKSAHPHLLLSGSEVSRATDAADGACAARSAGAQSR